MPVLDDGGNEGDETFTLVLSEPSREYLKDGTATGTISNDDALQRAWVARFGRTVAGAAVDAIAERLAGGGTRVTVGGQELPLGGGAEVGNRGQSQVLGLREALLASSFAVDSGGAADAPRFVLGVLIAMA